MPTDLILEAAIHQTLRTLMALTGTFVLIDAIGILLSPREAPAHRPKWSAASWAIIATAVVFPSIYLLTTTTGFVGDDNPVGQRFAIWYMYGGLTVGFTCRAISRAHRPWFTVFAVLGLGIAGVWFAVWDLVR